MRQSLAAALLLAVCGPCAMSQTTDLPTATDKEAVRIPSITREWKRPGQGNRPKITLDEIEQCLGQDVAMRREVQSVKQTQAQFDVERAELDSTNEKFKQQRAEIDQGRRKLTSQIAGLQAEGDSLTNRKMAMDSKRQDKPVTQADVRAFNALVQRFNHDVDQHNQRRAQLMKEQAAFNQSVEDYNATLASFRQRLTSFNDRLDLFQTKAQALALRADAHMDQCAGEKSVTP